LCDVEDSGASAEPCREPMLGVCVLLYHSQLESHWAAGEVGDLGEGRSSAIGEGIHVNAASGSAMIASWARQNASCSHLVTRDGDLGLSSVGGSP
jgi:hypothetical protein